ncbi:hypothetical protein RIF29_31814 [Crotalaria pallida]|uniref:Replication protein A 70 kDa DNA-binding subunit B/D first OB fold domain-containing protein n=1 Tax=Crotalaria pallida TaxID=3830 RepID=A0AAN9EMT7_CROPI
MDQHFTPIRNLSPALQHAVIRARVVMIWTVPCIRNFNLAFNLHMLLSDSKGDEIQATVCGPHVQFFARSLQESCVYDFAYFGLLRNLEKFRATRHEFRIKFRFYSTFEEIPTINFPPYVLKPNNVDSVFNSDVATSSLMDFYGIITAVSRESYYMHNRERIPVIGLELCDEYMLHSGFGRSVPMISYAGSKVSIEDQLMGDFPSPGYYTLTCYIADICQTTKWYYYECPCKAILRDPSIAMCRLCGSAVSKPMPRFRIPIVVADSTASMTLFLLDRDARVMLKQSCSDLFPFPLHVTFPPPFSLSFGSNSELPITSVENNKDFNVGSANGKGKSPMMPNSIGKVKEGLKRNLNVYHEMCSTGETSKGVKFSKMDFVNGASSSYSTTYTSTRAPE